MVKLTVSSFFLGVCKGLFSLAPFASREKLLCAIYYAQSTMETNDREKNSSYQLCAHKCEQHYIFGYREHLKMFIP
jgi:hypothetical protein